MTSKDRTGEQLVASIRKSKTGAVARKAAVASAAGKPAASSQARTTTKKPAQRGGADTYSAGRRVWPD
jgi:hypothetical protein